MITEINVKPNSDVSHILFFDYVDLRPFENRIIPLFGPNGVGKSTFIKAIESKQGISVSVDRPVHFFSYQNARDNFKVRNYMENFDLGFMNSKFDARGISEGQSIIYSMFDLLDGFMKNGDIQPEPGTDFLIVLDEIDSGMSIDNIDLTMRKIKYLSRNRKDLQFIFSFNSPRVVKHFPKVLSMYDGLPIELHDEEDMMCEINRHNEMFNKVRKNSKGRPKIFN